MQVIREVVLDCSTDEVWELVSDPGELSSWLGRDVDVQLSTVPGERVSFVWTDGDRVPSQVEFVLHEVDGGTRLTVTETAPVRASAAGGIRRLAVGGIGAMWDDRLLDLELRCLTRAAVLV
jgi:uncharacterized protein YndB with AHSA1/START domain